jgi:hypothetical protein
MQDCFNCGLVRQRAGGIQQGSVSVCGSRHDLGSYRELVTLSIPDSSSFISYFGKDMSLSDASQAEWPPLELIYVPNARCIRQGGRHPGCEFVAPLRVRKKFLGCVVPVMRHCPHSGCPATSSAATDAFPQQLRPEGIGMQPALFQCERLVSGAANDIRLFANFSEVILPCSIRKQCCSNLDQ